MRSFVTRMLLKHGSPDGIQRNPGKLISGLSYYRATTKILSQGMAVIALLLLCSGIAHAVPLTNVTKISSGDHHTCALTSTGGVKCWGENLLGQLGNNSTTANFMPIDVTGLASGVAAISSGPNYSCAITTTGGMQCWGGGSLIPTDQGLVNGVAVAGTCALTTVGGVKCLGAVGMADVAGLTSGVAAIATGGNHVCVLTTLGGMKCYGDNYAGLLGNNTLSPSVTPMDVTGLASGIAAISTGIHHSCALTTVGGVKCWGDNFYGQLGIAYSTLPASSVPVDVPGLTSGVTAISAGYDFTCALTALGGVKCWGLNTSGQLGDNSITNRLTPVDATGLTSGVIAISTGMYHTCALTTVGNVKCWGGNSYGQLGDNSTTQRLTPVDVTVTMPVVIPPVAPKVQLLSASCNGTVFTKNGITQLDNRIVSSGLASGPVGTIVDSMPNVNNGNYEAANITVTNCDKWTSVAVYAGAFTYCARGANDPESTSFTGSMLISSSTAPGVSSISAALYAPNFAPTLANSTPIYISCNASPAVSPASARLDVLQQFVIAGTGFTPSTTYAVENCTPDPLAPPVITATSITFQCTPTLPGSKTVSVNGAIVPGVTVNVDHPSRLGNASSRGIPSSQGVSLFNGNVHLEATDLAVPGKGVSFALTRSYNSYSWAYEAARGGVSGAAPWRFNWDLKLGYVGANTSQMWVQREDGSGESFFKDIDGIWYPMDQGDFNTIKGDTPILGQTTLFTREGLKYVFQNPDLGGKLIGIFDHDGNGLTITRDVSGRVGTVTDASNRLYTFTYDVNGNLFRVTDFANRFVEYTWELSVAPQVGVRLKTVRDVLGGITTYNYTLQTSYLTQNKPTDQTLLTSIIDPRLNTVRSYTYTDTVYGNWGASVVKDAYNNWWQFSYCANQPNLTCTSSPTAALSFETHVSPPLGAGVGAPEIVRFDTAGRLIERVDGNAKLSKTTPMPLAGLTSHTFNLSSLPVAKQSALGVAGNFSTGYAYTPDNAGNLAALTDAENATTTRGWLSGTPQGIVLATNNLQRVSQFTSATGALHNFTYDNVGKVLSYTPPALPAGGLATQLVYDPAGQVTSVTDGLGKTSSRAYDANGNLVTMTGPDALPVQNTYDNLGRALTSTDKRGNLTTNTWDVAGNLLTVKDALNGMVTYVYDANGNRIQMTDARGNVTHYTFDVGNRLKTVVKVNGLQTLTTTYNYDVLGRTISTVNANNHADSTAYDGVGNVLSRTNALAFATQYVYDADNRVIKTTDPEGRITDTSYDKVGRVKTVTTTAGTTSYVYDGDGRMTSSTDPRGKVTGYGYDAAGRLIALTDANGAVTHATYDANGNMLTVIDPNGKTTTYTYDVLNRPLTRTDANGQQWVTTYDQNGNVKTSTAPGNKVTTYTYDTLDRVSRVVYPDTSVVAYTYDANGNRLTMVDSTGTTNYTYDALDRMVSKTDPLGKSISYAYDGIGNVITLGYPGGQAVNYVYDAGERLTSLTDWLGKTTTYTLNRSGQVSAGLFGNNSRVDMLYDTSGRMNSLINKNAAGAIISSHGLTLDANGNITTATQQLPLQPSLTNINRAFTYDPANRLATFNGGAVTHDVAGRITGLAGNTYSYNDRDQITAITGTQAASYAYNGEGHRVSSNLNGQLTRFVIDSNRGLPEVLAETDSAGVVLRNYIYGYGLVEQIDSANVAHYYHYDPTGSTLALSNTAGVVTDSYAYTPYGETTASGTTVNPFRYVGKLGVMDDGNGMQYMRARYYRPEVARFMSLDQLAGSADRPQSLNRYAYALGNPVMGVDPSGLEATGTVYKGGKKNIQKIVKQMVIKKIDDKTSGLISTTSIANQAQKTYNSYQACIDAYNKDSRVNIDDCSTLSAQANQEQVDAYKSGFNTAAGIEGTFVTTAIPAVGTAMESANKIADYVNCLSNVKSCISSTIDSAKEKISSITIVIGGLFK